MRRVSRWIMPFVLVSVSADCKGTSEASVSRLDHGWARVVDRIMREGIQDRPACGRSVSASARPTVLIPLAAKHCASCMDIGYLLRQLESRGVRDVAIAVPLKDTESVCSYLKVEKSVRPVFPVSDSEFESLESVNGLRVAIRVSDSSYVTVAGRFAGDILARADLRYAESHSH